MNGSIVHMNNKCPIASDTVCVGGDIPNSLIVAWLEIVRVGGGDILVINLSNSRIHFLFTPSRPQS